MNEGYLGIDVGSISTKGVVIDDKGNILAQSYIYTKGNPIQAVKTLINTLHNDIKDKNIQIKGIGCTGSARKLVGILLDANVVKNEITAHAVGTLHFHPDVSTILEIGGQDSKIILLKDGIVTDYAMNTLCAAGTGSFLSSQAKRLGVSVEEFSDIALQSENPTKIAARCTVFAESDLVHKAQIGHNRTDIIAGLCKSIVLNYLNNVGKNKKITPPIVFQGGVSKNKGVIKFFENELKENIIVDEYGHLMGAIGVALLSIKQTGKNYDLNIKDVKFDTVGKECGKCPNNCEIIKIYKDKELIDCYGNKCDRGLS